MRPLEKRSELHHHSYNSKAADGQPMIQAAFKKEIPANLHNNTVQKLGEDLEENGWQFWSAEVRNNRLHVKYAPAEP